MSPRALFLAFSALSCLLGDASAKCGPPDRRKVVWTRKITEKSVPAGVEIFDRVWLKNLTPTALFIYTPEKGAESRTGYRKTLGEVPTNKDELPKTKLVNGERYEYHFPANPDFSTGELKQGGWVRQDFPAGLIESKPPTLPPTLETRIFEGKTKDVALRVPVPIYFGKKRATVELVYEFTKNPKYLRLDPSCPAVP